MKPPTKFTYTDPDGDVLVVRREAGRIYLKTGVLGVNIPLKDAEQLLKELTTLIKGKPKKRRHVPTEPIEIEVASLWEDISRTGRTIRVVEVDGDDIHYVQLTDADATRTAIAAGLPRYTTCVGNFNKANRAFFSAGLRVRGYRPLAKPEGEEG